MSWNTKSGLLWLLRSLQAVLPWYVLLERSDLAEVDIAESRRRCTDGLVRQLLCHARQAGMGLLDARLACLGGMFGLLQAPVGCVAQGKA